MSDVGVEALELLGEGLACEMRPLWQDGGVCGQIIREGQRAPSLGKSLQEVSQVLSGSSPDMDAAEAPGEEAHRDPEPALIFFA